MAEAVKDADNPFTKKLIAAMEAVFGQSPDLSVAMSGRHKFKAHLAATQRARQYAAWTSHTSKHKANGGGLYASMPRPAFRGFVAKQRNRQHNDTDIGVLMNLRLHSHCLHNLTGAQCTPPTPLGMRTCAACNALGNRAVEDETHFVLNCPVHKEERETMLERLRSIYPKFDNQWNISNDIQKMRILLWSIPDETAPWRPRDGTLSTARTQATGTVLRFLGAAAKRHPTMRNLMFGRAPGA